MSVPGSIVSAFSRPSLATIMVIPSRVVLSQEDGEGWEGDMRRVDVSMGNVGWVEGWEKVRIVGV